MHPPTRRDFLTMLPAAGLSASWLASAARAQQPAPTQREDNKMPRTVRYELLRPGELREIVEATPIAYVAFGSLEWHGQHLPVGCDTLKAHAVLTRAAEQAGGVVLPPVYFGYLGPWKPFTFHGLEEEAIDELYGMIFRSLVHWGFKVLIGITGHNVKEQRAAIQRAIDSVAKPGEIVGAAGWEVDFAEDRQNCNTDHAAKWETSDMMHLYPECVDMSLLSDADFQGEKLSDGPPYVGGIGGLDPREHASAEVGERCIELAAAGVAKKARELLASIKG
ncbi:MAG: creatininase family protein [Armatimonadota bacterium]